MQQTSTKETITLTEVIKHLNTGNPCNIIYVTADRRRGTGGSLEALKGWVKHNVEMKSSNAAADCPKLKSRIAAKLHEDRNPNHGEHKSMNLINLKSRKIQKLHLKLIVEYNGKTVLL